MTCKGCGQEIPSNQLFCSNCGLKNEAYDDGVKNTKRCVKCGKEFPEDRYYCDACGGNLAPMIPAPGPFPNQGQSYQGQPNQGQPNQGQPNQGQPNQVQSNQGQPNQQYNSPYPGLNNQMPPRPVPPYPLPPNQFNQNPNPGMPPIPPYQPMNTPKKNKALLPVLLGVAGLFVIVIGVFIISTVIKVINNSDTYDSSYDTTYDDGTYDDSTTDDGTYDDGTTDSSSDSSTDTSGDTDASSFYSALYSYIELPDVVSLDSDYRFSYYDYDSYDGVPTYTFQFTDSSASEADFYSAIDDYCSYIINNHGFYYEEEYTNEQYSQTGELTEYLSRDDVSVSVTASVEDTGYYAYVLIYPLSDSADSSTFENYSTYIVGRDSQSYDAYTEVTMDNGMAFYLNDVTLTDSGDGTAVLSANVDLAALYDDWYFYTDDLIVLPMDSYGNILSDACLVNSITDSDGNSYSTPLLLDTEYYDNYTITFIVPSDTINFTVYGTNITEDSYAGPVYYTDMHFDE